MARRTWKMIKTYHYQGDHRIVGNYDQQIGANAQGHTMLDLLEQVKNHAAVFTMHFKCIASTFPPT